VIIDLFRAKDEKGIWENKSGLSEQSTLEAHGIRRIRKRDDCNKQK
jgi:hypothetical protein